MKHENSKLIEWGISIASIVGIPLIIFQLSEKALEHFGIPFNISFFVFWFAILIFVLFKIRQNIGKFFISSYKFIYNLKYVIRLDEVEPFKTEKHMKIFAKSKNKIIQQVHKKMLRGKKGALTLTAILIIVLIILLVIFYLKKKGII